METYENKISDEEVFDLLFFVELCQSSNREDLLNCGEDLSDRDNYYTYFFECMEAIFERYNGLFDVDDQYNLFTISNPQIQAHLNFISQYGKTKKLSNENNPYYRDLQLYLIGRLCESWHVDCDVIIKPKRPDRNSIVVKFSYEFQQFPRLVYRLLQVWQWFEECSATKAKVAA
ncbi:hypothetical protein LJC32_02005 [Oscillospiraceae bacterium OttesenSCG-928-F05]|nr:hypothetical protein [Oscillospiraceae bacterium OttesenSCG-928-F05]